MPQPFAYPYTQSHGGSFNHWSVSGAVVVHLLAAVASSAIPTQLSHTDTTPLHRKLILALLHT